MSNLKTFMSRKWDATTAFFERVWRGFWFFILKIHYFRFWRWVERQAYGPPEFDSAGRYDMTGPADRYGVIIPQAIPPGVTRTEFNEDYYSQEGDRYSR